MEVEQRMGKEGMGKNDERAWEERHIEKTSLPPSCLDIEKLKFTKKVDDAKMVHLPSSS